MQPSAADILFWFITRSLTGLDPVPKEVNCNIIVLSTQSSIETSFNLLLKVNNNVIFFHYSVVKSLKFSHQWYCEIVVFPSSI